MGINLGVAFPGVLVELRHAAIEEIPGTEILGFLGDRPFQLGTLQFRCDDGGDPSGQLVLQIEYVFQPAIERLRPHVVAALRMDKLGGDADSLARFSGDPEQEYFTDGLTEDVITALSLFRSFPVIARIRSPAFRALPSST